VNKGWIVKPKPNPEAKIKLICLPFAGGGSISFRKWALVLPAPIELITVEIPGRGARITEPLRKRIDAIVPDIATALLAELDKPFAVFGHSMGTLLGFELNHYLEKHYHLQPAHLFFSGRGAPHLPNREAPIHQLAHDDFIGQIKQFDGTPREVLENQELMELMVPILRADFEACETYIYQKYEPFSCPMTVFGSLQDSGTTKDMLQEWEKHTTGVFNLRMFPGGHFFLLRHSASLIESMLRDLNKHFPLF